MMKRLSVLGLLSFGAVVASAPSCASIVSRSKYDVTINSIPTQAIVRVLNRRGAEVAVGQTPVTFRLKAKEGFFKAARYTVVFNKEGYEEKIMPLEAEFDPWYVGNLLFGGIIGFIVDAGTGSMWKIDDDMINASLSQKPQPVASVKDASTGKELAVYDLSDVSEEWKQRMTKIQINEVHREKD